MSFWSRLRRYEVDEWKKWERWAVGRIDELEQSETELLAMLYYRDALVERLRARLGVKYPVIGESDELAPQPHPPAPGRDVDWEDGT